MQAKARKSRKKNKKLQSKQTVQILGNNLLVERADPSDLLKLHYQYCGFTTSRVQFRMKPHYKAGPLESTPDRCQHAP